MISLKRYLEMEKPWSDVEHADQGTDTCRSLVWAYRAALAEMADCGSSACSASSADLKMELTRVEEILGCSPDLGAVKAAKETLREVLHKWGKKTALYTNKRPEKLETCCL